MATAQMSRFLRRLTRGMAAETLGELTDRQLLERLLAAQDEAVFEALVRRHGPSVYRVCWRVLQHAEDTEDAFQATFLLLARKLQTVRKRDSLASWLHGVAHRVALDAKAQAARCRRHEARAAANSDPRPPEEITWRELRTVLDSELGRLPEKWRLPLILCYLEGRSQEEAARQLDWSKSTLLRRLEEARAALGRRLTRRGVVWPAALSAVLLSDCVAPAALAPGLVGSTVEAATLVAAGQATPGIISAKVAALTEGVMKAMLLTKLKIVTALLLGVAFAGLGVGLYSFHAQAAGHPEEKNEQPAQPATPSRFLKGDDRIGRLAWGPDGKTLASVTYRYETTRESDEPQLTGSAVRLWHVQTGEVRRTLAEDEFKVGKLKHLWQHVAFSQDGKLVAAVSDGCDGGTKYVGVVRVWDAATGKLQHSLKHTLLVRSVAFAPDGKTVATGSGGNVGRDFETVQLWDVGTGKLLRSLEATNKMAVALAFAPDGKTLGAVLQMGGGDNDVSTEVTLWDAVEGKLLQTVSESDGFDTIAFSPDGKALLGAGRDKLRVWAVETAKAREASDIRPDFSEGSWSAFAFAPDGKTAAVSGKQGDKYVVTLWDVKAGKLTRKLEGHEGFISSLAFSRDGMTLASGSHDKTVRFWDLAEQKIEKK